MTPVSDEDQNEMDIIKVFKDAIPHTHGAPERAAKAPARVKVTAKAKGEAKADATVATAGRG